MLHDGEKASVERLIDYLDIVKTPHKNTADKEKLYNDFKAFFAQYDIRRGKSFTETFPGPLADWFNSLSSEIPTAEKILSKELQLDVSDTAIDPKTTETYIDQTDDVLK